MFRSMLTVYSDTTDQFTQSDLVLIDQIQWINAYTGTVTTVWIYEGWNFNSGNYLFTTDTK